MVGATIRGRSRATLDRTSEDDNDVSQSDNYRLDEARRADRLVESRALLIRTASDEPLGGETTVTPRSAEAIGRG